MKYEILSINDTQRNKMKHFSLKESEESYQSYNGYDVKRSLRQMGYSSVLKLASTLQGILLNCICYLH